MSVPIRCERLLAQKLRFMARLHFGWSCSGEHRRLRIVLVVPLLPVLLFLLLTAAAATAAIAAVAAVAATATAAATAAAAGDLLCRHLWPLHQRS